MIIRIDDPADPRIAAFRDIRERDLVGRQGLFVAEGEVVLGHLLRSPLCEALAVLVDEKRLDALAPLLALAGEDIPIHAAAQGVLDAIAGFHLHRGILALGRRRAVSTPGELLDGLGPEALVVVLQGIGNHDNMGGLFRNAAAFGADAVLLCADCCDPLYRKAIRVGVGAPLIMPFARFEAEDDPVAGLTERSFEVLALSPSGERTLAEIAPVARTAVLFGAEGPGLPPAMLARTTTVAIPMAAGFDSLNVATTSGIVLHHLTNQAVCATAAAPTR